MAITAPFRFARINRKVYFPEWGDLVSHDVPFKDGYSGEVEFTITTKTPLLLGGDRKEGAPGEVWPFIGPDGRYAIPGSSIQGMIRSILEIATFSKLGPNVQDQRFGVRDISGSATGRKLYQKRMTLRTERVITPQSKAGWLRKDSKGGVEIVECHLARIEIDEVADLAKSKRTLTDAERDLVCAHLHRLGNHYNTKNWKDADKRYEEFLGDSSLAALNFGIEFLDGDGMTVIARDDQPRERAHSRNNLINYIKCQPASAGGGSEVGTLVLSGKASTANNPGYDHTKHMEFVFYGPARTQVSTSSNADSVDDDVWRDFLLIHNANTGQNAKPNPNWTFWKEYFDKGEPVPVFYIIEEGRISAIGTAQMFKLAMSLSTHDLLAHSDPKHVEKFDGDPNSETGKLDLPSLIFGAIGGEKDADFRYSLKRRVAFDIAKVPENVNVAANYDNPAVALLAPKPNYYPIYVKQSPQHNQYNPYAAYENMGNSSQETERPQLSGVKIWPVSGQVRLNAAAQMQDRTNVPSAVRTKLNTIPSATTFNGTVRIHNLREVELGALLWAMTFGQKSAFEVDEEVLRHRIGGGKPYGLGEIEIRIAKMNTVFRNDKETTLDGATLITNFKNCMEKFIGKGWEVSEQITALLKAAGVNNNVDQDQLHYMNGYADYAEQRAANQTLGDYVTATRELVAQIEAAQIGIGMHVKSGPQQGVVLSIAAHGRTVKVALDGSGRHADFGVAGLQIIT